MPISRMKSCHQCRIAKARCSLVSPCSRCTERGLRCQYPIPAGGHHEPHKAGGPRPIRSAAEPTVREVLDKESCEAERNAPIDSIGPPVTMLNWTEDGVAVTTSASDSTLREASGLDTFETELSVDPFVATVGPPVYHYFQSPLFQSHTPLLSIPPLSVVSPSLPPEPAEQFNSCCIMIPRLGSLNTWRRPHLLSPRFSKSSEAFFTAKVLVSQITVWPRMLISGKRLPPFIHPACATELSLYDCPPEATAHLCLPETLAICASLLQMFYTRTPGSCAFVWEQIYAHQKTLHKEYQNYSVQTLLDALQTAVIYVILQAQDTDSVDKNDVLYLLATTEDMARRFYSISLWGSNAFSQSYPGRRDWILTESARRLACVLYEVKVLLNISPDPPDEASCTDYVNVPLPCGRELWEAVPNREWERRYRRELALKGQRRSQGLGLGDLIFPQRTQEIGQSGATRTMEELTVWCENVDEFGMLLWMTAKLDRGS